MSCGGKLIAWKESTCSPCAFVLTPSSQYLCYDLTLQQPLCLPTRSLLCATPLDAFSVLKLAAGQQHAV
eukprot:12907767-Prorocentrum_lima.AAC.1